MRCVLQFVQFVSFSVLFDLLLLITTATELELFDGGSLSLRVRRNENSQIRGVANRRRIELENTENRHKRLDVGVRPEQHKIHNNNNSDALLPPPPTIEEDTTTLDRSNEGSWTEPHNSNYSHKEEAAQEIWMDGIRVRKIDKSPFDIVMEEKDLIELAHAVSATKWGQFSSAKKVASTIFAPIDSAYHSLPFNITDGQNGVKFPNRTHYLTSIIEYHLVAPRLIEPSMITEVPYKVKTRFGSRMLVMRRKNQTSILGNATLTVNGYAEVKEIIKARRGWIYKIDAVLGPQWNDGPSLVEYIRHTPWLSKSRYLMEAAASFNSKTEFLGPITILLIPDSGWKMRGFDLPDCVFQTLTAEEHQPLLRKILKWLLLPGLWTAKEITEVSFLPNGVADELRVSHVLTEYPTDQRLDHGRNILKPFNRSHSSTVESDFMDEHDEVRIGGRKRRGRTLIEDREVVKWSIPVHNGWAHILSELPDMKHFKPVLALWNCVHEFCFECPKVSGHLLQFFDEGGLIPSQRPLHYVVPPGSRPSWVCQGSSTWFPPGWDPKKWYRYIDHAKMGHPRAPRESQAGSIAAAQKMTELRYKLDDARVKLKRIQTQLDVNVQHFRPLWDPKALVSFATSTRHVSGMPECVNHDDVEAITMSDMEYLSRWM